MGKAGIVGVVAAALLCVGALPAAAAAGGAASPTEGVRLSVASGLADGQSVRVRATGLVPGTEISFLECYDQCAHPLTGTTTADARGQIDATVAVARFIQVDSEDWGYPPGDCAYDACSFAVAHFNPGHDDGDGGWVDPSYTVFGRTPIAFTAVDTVTPSASMHPAGPLPLVSFVGLDGAGFAPGSRVHAMQCFNLPPTGKPDCNWDWESIVAADAVGHVELGEIASRLVNDVDCLAPGVVCTMRIFDDAHGVSTIPLRFDPSIPVPRRPELTVSSSPIGPGTTAVRVRGRWFEPGTSVGLRQCFPRDASPPARFSSACPGGTGTTADSTGAIDVMLPVRRYSPIEFFAPMVDCASTACTVTASEHGDRRPSGYRTVTAGLRFAADPAMSTLRLRGTVVPEGNTPGQVATIRARLNRPTDHGVTFGWWGGGGGGVVTIPAGATSVEFTYQFVGDTVHEADRLVSLYLLFLDGAQPDRHHATARVRIVDDDPVAVA